jgi:signal transduction histidine kinase
VELLDTNLDQATRLIEIERAQIGHEIHDALLPLIFAASASVSGLVDQSSQQHRQRLQQASDWLDDAMQIGRQLLTQVYPPELIDKSWSIAATDALQRLFPQSDTKIEWQVEAEADRASVPIAWAAYRIVVEAVRNAIRHGKASEVGIVGEQRPHGIRVIVRDNGCGFEPSQVPSDRFGIRSMVGRAELVGGSLKIDSAPGGPTTVTFVTDHDAP